MDSIGAPISYPAAWRYMCIDLHNPLDASVRYRPVHVFKKQPFSRILPTGRNLYSCEFAYWIMARLQFGVCKNCGHSIAMRDSVWLHHISRSRLLNLPHWPAGHVLTEDCKWHCDCRIPEPDPSRTVKSKFVYLGRATDRWRTLIYFRLCAHPDKDDACTFIMQLILNGFRMNSKLNDPCMFMENKRCER